MAGAATVTNSKAQGYGCLILLGIAGLAYVFGQRGADEPEFLEMAGVDNWAMIASKDADPAAMAGAAKVRCGMAAQCSVFGWLDKADAARAFPMTDTEVSSMVFSYKLNRTTGFEQTLWDCRHWPQKDRRRCL